MPICANGACHGFFHNLLAHSLKERKPTCDVRFGNCTSVPVWEKDMANPILTEPAQSASRVQSAECRGSEVRRVVGLVRVQQRCKANRAHFSRTRLCACTLQIIAEPLRGILLPPSHLALVLLPSTPDQLDGPLGFYASTWACTCCPSGASYLPAMLWLPGLLHSIACP